MPVHLGEEQAQPLEGFLLGAGESLNSVPIPDKGALADPVAFWLLFHHVDPRHGFNQSRHVEVLFFVGYVEGHALGSGFFSSPVLVCVVLLGHLCAAGGVTSPLGLPVPQEVKNFIAKT